MSKKSEKKQIIQLWALVVLIIILIAVFANLFIKVMRIRRQETIVAQQYSVQSKR